MGLPEVRRKEAQDLADATLVYTMASENSPSSQELRLAKMLKEYEAILAEAERERDETGRLLRSYDDPRVTRWWLQRDEIESRVRELEKENARLQDQLRQVREVCLEDASRYSRPSIGRWKRLLNLPANRYLQKQAATSTSCRFSKCGKR